MVDLGLFGAVGDSVDQELARCRDADVDAGVFFSEALPDIATAKAACGECSQVASCLEGATARREPLGVWGGELFVNGVAVPFKRGRGRPRKTPLAVPA